MLRAGILFAALALVACKPKPAAAPACPEPPRMLTAEDWAKVGACQDEACIKELEAAYAHALVPARVLLEDAMKHQSGGGDSRQALADLQDIETAACQCKDTR